MRIACWIPKATTHSQNKQYVLAFHHNIGWTKALRCYYARKLSVLFIAILENSLKLSYCF